MPPCFAEIFPDSDLWVLQEWLGCQLLVEETLVRRIAFVEVECEKEWWVDGGNGRMGWYENGQMRWQENFKDDKRHGLSEGWHENGQVCWRVNCKDGKRHGLCEGWHENGQMAWRTNWRDGIQIN